MTLSNPCDEGSKPNLPLPVLPAYQRAQPVKKAAEQAELFGQSAVSWAPVDAR